MHKKRRNEQLEDDIDALNSKLAGLSRDSGAASSEAQQEHQKQMAQLRDQIALKNSEINRLKESMEELQMAKEKLVQDYERLKKR